MSIYRGRTKKEFYVSSLLYNSIDDRDFCAIKSLLIEKGADPNIVQPKKGISPFHLVIGSEPNDFAVKVARLILQYGGNPNVRSDDGLTPVHIAAAWGRLEILTLLLASGGDPEIRDRTYMTPYHYAKKEGHEDCLALLKSFLPVKNEIFNIEKEDCKAYSLMLDKVLVNDGQAIGEYEIVADYHNDSITKEKNLQSLQDLPQSDSKEYVMNWFSTHHQATGGPTFVKLPKSTGSSTTEENFNSFESSIDESENEHLRKVDPHDITFRKSYKKTRKVTKNSGDSKKATPVISSKAPEGSDPQQDISLGICASFEGDENFSKARNFSKESGIVSLQSFSKENSLRSDAMPDNNLGGNLKSDKGLTKAQDTSSDYLTCSSNSLFEKNVFEITEDVSPIIFTSDESKSVRSLESYNAKSEGLGSSNDLSFVSVSEVYKYVDKEEGIVLYERRFLKTPSECNGSIKSTSFSSKLSSLPGAADYDTDTLRKELTLYGYAPGPITVSTKRVYLKKLHQLKKHPAIVHKEEKVQTKRVYSLELEKTLRDASWSSDLALYKSLEATVLKQFNSPDPTRKWREGVNKSSFTYLLLDPRITNNLPCRAEFLQPKDIWELFLSSVFYIGKGKRARPYSHLYEAVTLWNQGIFVTDNKKLQHIIDIWKSSTGVICLHVFQNTIPVEAYTREAAMISALKTENLTNVRAGDFYGIAATWPQKQKKMLGVYLLYKAMMIFLNEGERQLCPSDIN